MKILLDISVLAAGHLHPRNRTGIYRATEGLANQLVNEPSCQLSFMAYGSLPFLASARSYLATNEVLCNAELVAPEGYFASRITDMFTHLAGGYSLATHAIRGMHRIAGWLPHNPAQPSLTQLGHYDIVHATYLGIPAEWHRLSSPCRFQTVYDLIPLILPQFTTTAHQRATRSCIDALQPDDWVVAISTATKNDLCEYRGLDPNKVFVTPLAASASFYRCIDTARLHDVKVRYGIPDSPYVLSLCTLEPRKNIPHLISSFADLVEQERIKDLNLVLVGATGWQHSAIFRELRKYKHLAQRIIITGYVNDDDLAPLYSGAVMFVYPSFYEGFGLPPLEAMQCGVPVITSNTSSLPEVVGDAGIMVSPLDKSALCEAMLDIYRKPSYAKKMSQLSLSRAALFSWKRCSEQTIAAYNLAIGK